MKPTEFVPGVLFQIQQKGILSEYILEVVQYGSSGLNVIEYGYVSVSKGVIIDRGTGRSARVETYHNGFTLHVWIGGVRIESLRIKFSSLKKFIPPVPTHDDAILRRTIVTPPPEDRVIQSGFTPNTPPPTK